MAHVPTVPNFAQYNFALGDTDAAITKQNGQNAALVMFGNQLRQTMTTLNTDINQIAQDKQDAAQSASDALTYRNETQEISEGGLPPKAGNAKSVLRVADDEQSYVLDKLLRFVIPAGAVMGFPFAAAPAGWLKCNGAAISRTAYADLFTAIGTSFGAGDGSTTFNLPDYRGEFPRWLDDGRGVDSGRGIGESQGDQNKAHDHGGNSAWDGSHNHGASSDWNGSHNHGGNTNPAGGHRHDMFQSGFAQSDNSLSSGNRVAMQGTDNVDGTARYAMRNSSGGDNRGVTGWVEPHGHGISGDGHHNHNISVSGVENHRHQISTDGGNEARPRNMPLLACIRY